MNLDDQQLRTNFCIKYLVMLLTTGLFVSTIGCGQRATNQKNVQLWNRQPVLTYSSVLAAVRDRIGDRKLERARVQAEAFLGPRLSRTNTKDTFTLVLSIIFNPEEIAPSEIKNAFSVNGSINTADLFKLSTPTIPSVYLLPSDQYRHQSSTGFDSTGSLPSPFCCMETISETLAIAIVRYVVLAGRDLIHEQSYVNIELTYPALGKQLYDLPGRIKKYLDIEYVNPCALKVQNYNLSKDPYYSRSVADWP